MGKYFFCALLVFILQSTTSSAQYTLPVHSIKQIKSRWCWAACAQMVDSFYRGNQSMGQCKIAYNYYKSTNKPFTLNSSSCICNSCSLGICSDNYPFDFFTNNLDGNYHRILLRSGYYSNFDTLITWKEVKNQIDKCRPFLIFISLRGGGRGGHMVLVKGYEETPSKKLIVNDPWRWGSNCYQCDEFEHSIDFDLATSTQCVFRIDAAILNIVDKYNILNGDCTNVYKPLNADVVKSITSQGSIEVETIYISDTILSQTKTNKISLLRLPIISREVYNPNTQIKELQQKINDKYTTFYTFRCEEKTDIKLKKGHKEFLLNNSIQDRKYTNYKKIIFPYPDKFEFYYFENAAKKEFLAPVLDYADLGLKSNTYYSSESALSTVRKHLEKSFPSIK